MRVADQKAITSEEILRMASRPHGLIVGRTRPEPYLKQKCDALVQQGKLTRLKPPKFTPRSRAMYVARTPTTDEGRGT